MLIATVLAASAVAAQGEAQNSRVATAATPTGLPVRLSVHQRIAARDPTAIELADVDGDGDPDLLTIDAWNGPIVRINEGGRFTRELTLPRLESPSFGTLCDVDGDGYRDLFVCQFRRPNRLFRWRGAGFEDVTDASLPSDEDESSCVAKGDLDRDGDDDLIVGSTDGHNRLYLNNGKGVFTDMTGTRLPSILAATRCVQLLDVDGDGDLDLFAGNRGPDTLLLNDGSGRFEDVTATHLPACPWCDTRQAATGDIDGDGDLDLILAGTAGNKLYVNSGKGRFEAATTALLPAGASRGVAVADLDRDGRLDLVFAGAQGSSTVLLSGSGEDDGRYRALDHAFPGDARSVALGDVDSDGAVDIVLDDGRGTVVYRNDGGQPRRP